jgi:hypothetical protein
LGGDPPDCGVPQSLGAGDSRYGVVAAEGIGNDCCRFNNIKDLGVRWVRVGIDWNVFEPEKGQIEWILLQKIVDHAKARGLNLYWNFGYAPGWANGGRDKQYPPTPAHQSDLKEFIKQVVGRYKNDVKYWGHWNEVNLPLFYQPPSDDRVEYFRNNELKTTIEAIREADGTAKIVAGELASRPSPDLENLGKILDTRLSNGNKVGEVASVISQHIYDGRDELECVQRYGFVRQYQTEIARLGFSHAHFWITETGLNPSGGNIEQKKSEYLKCFLGLFKLDQQPDTTKIFWYRLERDRHFGLLNGGDEPCTYTPNATFFAYQNFIQGVSGSSTPPGSSTCGAMGGTHCQPLGAGAGCPQGYQDLGLSSDCNPCCKAPTPPSGASCGSLGGDYCEQSGSCPQGYDSLGTTYDCNPCCKRGPSCGSIGGDHCEQSGACPPGHEDLGRTYDCSPCCKRGPSCGSIGGDHCEQSGACPLGHDDLGPTYDCNPCCKTGPSCGSIGGNQCEQSGTCPVGYEDRGRTYDCNPCCRAP